MLSFLLFLLCISLIVGIHEAGHYLVARLYGIAIATYAIGMGPKILNWTAKSGTNYQLRAIPVGGFCRWATQSEINCNAEHPVRGRAFLEQPPSTRLWIALGGPAINILLAFALLVVSNLQLYTTTIKTVIPNGPLARAGVSNGDTIEMANGTTVSYATLAQLTHQGKPLTILYRHGNETKTATVVPQDTKNGNGFKIGFYPVPTFSIAQAPAALATSTQNIIDMTTMQVDALQSIVTKPSRFISESSGIIGAAAESRKAEEHGIASYLKFAAVLSFLFGVFQLLPIPILDGGRSVFTLIEMLTHQRVNERIERMASAAGLGIIVLLMIYATQNDLAAIMIAQRH